MEVVSAIAFSTPKAIADLIEGSRVLYGITEAMPAASYAYAPFNFVLSSVFL
ncbi:hypothetical protein [Nostoc sp.]|uniref:hypothetical protein n=1 Tax=Nostoc sp. TaxID=1180 RepID=UPI002FFD3663